MNIVCQHYVWPKFMNHTTSVTLHSLNIMFSIFCLLSAGRLSTCPLATPCGRTCAARAREHVFSRDSPRSVQRSQRSKRAAAGKFVFYIHSNVWKTYIFYIDEPPDTWTAQIIFDLFTFSRFVKFEVVFLGLTSRSKRWKQKSTFGK